MSDSSSGSNEGPGPYEVDKQLYEDFWNWLTWKLPDHRSDGADNAAGDMYDFLQWIHETNRPPMADRIALPSLDIDVRAYAADYIGREVPVIGGLRNRLLNLKDMLRDLDFWNWARERRVMFQGFDGGGPSSLPLDYKDGSSESGRSDRGSSGGFNQGPGPYEEDRQLYQDFWNWLTEKLSDRRSRGADIAAGDMHDFLEWIRETNRPPMADRIALASLDTDVRAYAADYIGREVSAIGGFRNRLLNLREMLRDFEIENWARARGAMFQGFEGALSSLPLAPAIPSDRERSAANAWIGMPERDFGACVLSDWRGGAAPDILIAELRKSHLLPMLLRPRRVLINGMRYVAAVWPGRGVVTPNNPEGENIILTPGYRELALQPQLRVEPMNEVGPSSSARPADIRPASGGSGGYYQRPNLPDIGTRVGAGWIHGPRVADTVLVNALRDFGLLPTCEIPMPCFYIHREPYT
ncbi:hypothetical protein QMZ05_28380, partial [Bradyrhizobium sp. INPA03-11B]